MKKHELELFMTDMNSLEALPSQPRSHRKTKSGVVTPRNSKSGRKRITSIATVTPGSKGPVTPANNNSLEALPSQPRSHRKTKSGVVTPRNSKSGRKRITSIATVTPGSKGPVTPANNKRKNNCSSSKTKSGVVTPRIIYRSSNNSNISAQDLMDGMRALESGFTTILKVNLNQDELEKMLDRMTQHYERGYCADLPGNNVEGKHVIKL
jgi:co-chaperonin GroES (HSP10)